MDLYVASTFGVDKQLAEIRDPARIIEMAWCGDQAVGFFHLWKCAPDPSVTGPKPIEVLRLYVDSGWHGKGVAAALMARIILIAQAEGFQTLWLGVGEQNYRAQKFYRKHGFDFVGTHIFRLGTDDQVDFIMARTIDPLE